MRRIIAAAFVALVAAPVTATAQSLEPELNPRLRISPWIGYRPGYGQQGAMAVITPDTTTTAAFEFESDGATAGGIDVDLRVLERWSVLAGYAFAGGDVVRLRTGFDDGASVQFLSEPRLHLAKVGVAFSLREPEPDFRLHRPTASVFVAPSFVWADPPDVGLGELDDAFRQYALNFGFKGETPLFSRRVLLHVGAEDYFTFWDDEMPSRRFSAGAPEGESVLLEYDPSHVLILRVGVTFSF